MAERSPGGQDWDAVARAVQARLDEVRMTQMDVASRAQVSLTTLREIQHNLNPRRRRPQTLAAISEALGWPQGYLTALLTDDGPEPGPDEAAGAAGVTVSSLEQEVRDLRGRVEEIERRLSGPR